MNERPDARRGEDNSNTSLSGACSDGKGSLVPSNGSLVVVDGDANRQGRGEHLAAHTVNQQCRTPANDEHPRGFTLTQRDCVVWKESGEADLPPLSQATPTRSPPSAGAASSGAESASLATRRAKSRMVRARSDNADGARNCPIQPSTATTVAPLDSSARSSPLESVTKCLETCEGQDMGTVTVDATSRSGEGATINGAAVNEPAPSDVEIDRIFRRLESEKQRPNNDASTSSSASAAASSPSPDGTAHVPPADGVGDPTVTFKSRKRRRQHTHTLALGSTRPQPNLDGKENAVNPSSNPAALSIRQPFLMEFGEGAALDCDTKHVESGVDSAAMVTTCDPDPFRDLIREFQLKPNSHTSEARPEAEELQLASRFSEGDLRCASHQRDHSSGVGAKNGSKPCSPRKTNEPPERSDLMCECEGSTYPTDPSTQALATPRARPSNSRADPVGVMAQNEFGDVDFSLEDLALIDSMVHHASQGDAARGDVSGSQEDLVSSASVPNQPAQSPDPFGEFPEIDFDALDKSIADHQVQLQPINTANVNQNPARSPGCLQFTRYSVLHVNDDPYRFLKALAVQLWTRDMVQDTSVNDRSSSRTMAPEAKAAKPPTPHGEIHLCGDWYFTPLVEGDVIHVCSPSGRFHTLVNSLNPLTLDTHREDDLLLIVHPDMLLTPTTISETVTCSRRAVLKNRLGSTGLSDKAPLFGTMRHALFEELIRLRDFSMASAKQACKVIVRKNAESLVAAGLTSRDAETEILKVVPQIQQFVAEFTTFGESKRGKSGSHPNLVPAAGSVQAAVHFIVHDVEAIEEVVVSPELGLKGNIDMVVRAQMTSDSPLGSRSESSLTSIELKTGHNQNAQHSHMAQLSLYTLMLNALYGGDSSQTSVPTNVGVLLYLNSEAVKAVHVAPKMFEMKALIGNRNLVAIETHRSSQPRGVVLVHQNETNTSKDTSGIGLLDPTPALLPDVLNNSHPCERCYMNRECMVYAAASEAFKPGAPEVSILRTHKGLLDKFTGRLRDDDLSYFVTWDRLVDLEGNSCTSHTAEAWLVNSLERERTTLRCMSSLAFETGTVGIGSSVLLTFQRIHHSSQQSSLQNLSFEHGCHVVISTDDTTASSQKSLNRPHMHIVRGLFEHASENRVTIRASPDELARLRRVIQRSGDPSGRLFRLDRDEVATGLGTLRQNLVNLFSRDAGQEVINNRLSWLRDVIVRLKPPAFDHTKKDAMFDPPLNVAAGPYPGCDFLDLYLEYAELNDDQRAAVDNVLAAKDYSMIQGLPGTGKTSTIAFLARLLVAHGKRVLITSYTNSAVDNVLLKLMESGLSATSPTITSPAMIRIGRDNSTHPGVHPILAASAAIALETSLSSEEDIKGSLLPSADSLSKCVQAARVVGATALTLPRSPLLAKEHFDFVIVDEAGQITQPAVLGALMSADSFILVGDHKQLPPLVANEVAEMGGFGDSMLKRLAEAHPTSVAMLSYQYRMNHEICSLSNEVAYGGALKCADESVAHRKLDLPGFPENLGVLDPQSWLLQAVNPDFPVIFIDTDAQRTCAMDGTLVPLERTTGRNGGGSIVNDTEVGIVRTVVGSLLSCGLAASNIGLICPFRAQLRLLNEHDQVKTWKSQGLEVSTIDRYQGRDKDAIVLSFVRSNSKGRVGRLLEDYRRLNVAVTRAKCKLVMVGSFSTLFEGSSHLRGSLERLKKEGKVMPCGCTTS